MDVYVIYPVLFVDIYVISLFVLMESKKTKNNIFPLFAECHTRQRGLLPSAMTIALNKAGMQITNFPALPSARALALGKEISKKILCRVQDCGTRQRNFKKKRKNSLSSAADVALGKEAVTVDGRFFLPSVYMALDKAFAECPIFSTRQRNLCRQILCRVLFAECGTLGKKPVCSSDQISIIRCTIEYIFIMFLFYVINIVTLFYKISQT
jgi:hypothetical protein